MKKVLWVLLACVAVAAPAAAQSQYQTTFEFGLGYTRPSVEEFDMVSLLMQGDDFYFETGLGFRLNAGYGDNNILSWMLRAAARPIVLGNTTVHVGGEFSVHTNATVRTENGQQKAKPLIGVGALFGVSHPITDHFNVEVHVYPLAFDFGGEKTITKFGVAETGAHILF